LSSASEAEGAGRSGPATILRLDGVTKAYGGKIALDAISLNIPDNAYMALLGSSGAGKTVLLRTIAGFETLDRGAIFLRGAPVDGVPAHRRGIGFVFQNFALFPHLNVFENIAFGLRNGVGAQPDRHALDAKVRAMIDLVGLGGLEQRAVTAISGGQRQRVALARTLVTEPQMVLLDEPLGALDANLRTRMCGELRRIRERLGVTFLHVTGSETEALAMGDQVVVLDEGRIAQVGRPDHVYTRPLDARVARFLNCYNLLDGRMVGGGFEAEGQVLPCAQVGPADAAVYALRQDLIRVEPAWGHLPAREPRLPATFVASEYSGPSVASFFRLRSGAVVTVEDHLSHRDPQVFEQGRSYDLTWHPEDALVLSRRAGAAA
jgi:putative spermidine/putrescine transport system ATP-binding protein